MRGRLALLTQASHPDGAHRGDAPKASSPTDAELAGRLQAGDRAALGAIYEKYAPTLLPTITRLLARRSEAEDVLQETFVIAFRKAAQLRELAALRGWLFQIAVHEAHAQLRRRRRFAFFGAGRDDASTSDATLAKLAASGASPEVHAELALLDRELARMPADHRIAWMLRYVEGEALEDVAIACGCSLATVKRWIAAADQIVGRHVVAVPPGAEKGGADE
jgi:RNA polymerase sigma-70 factor, ECF subfamily